MKDPAAKHPLNKHLNPALSPRPLGRGKGAFQDKVAIITGSSMGIGRAIARKLGEEGAQIVLNGRNPESLEKTLALLRSEGIEATAFQGDISKVEDCKELVAHAVKEYGGIDILVNNAGVSAKGYFEEFSPEVFPHLIHTNVLGGIFATRESLPHIRARKGSILFISSLSGLRGIPHHSPYSLTKMAQTALAESLRAELYKDKVHVGIVYVGITENDPDKTLVAVDGGLRALKQGASRMEDSQERVAKAVRKALANKQFKTTVGWKGKAYFLLSRYFPWVLDFVFRNFTAWIEKNDS